MCGIAGIFNYRSDGTSIDRVELSRISDNQKKRGPDAEGTWFSEDGQIGFGHRRLSIIDLDSQANQPMVSANRRYVIVFNGEIYNYQKLRKALVDEGCHFHTKSDTEVLLSGYARWGTEMFSRLRGMYAFSLWDDVERRLLLVRDPYGIKPLYIADDGRTIRIASQVKAILAGGQVSKEADPAGLTGFLMMGSVPEPYTASQAVRAIPAGHFLYVDENGVGKPTSYFSIQEVWRKAAENPITSTSESLQEVVSGAIRESIRHHLVSDVPVAAFLSAGIDSGAVVGLMKEVSGADVLGITLGFQEFQGSHSDETPLAAKIAKHYECEHLVHWMEDEQVEQDLPCILAAMDQPSVDGVNTWLVSKAAHEAGVKVVLSGVGGDELFGGYDHFGQFPRWAHRIQKLARIPGLRGLAELMARITSRWQLAPTKAADLLKYGDSYAGMYLVKRGLFMPWELPALLDKEFVQAGLNALRPPEFVKSMLGRESTSSFATIATLEAVFYLRNQLLRDSDWASMAHSLELRTPLVDAHLLATLAPFLINRPQGLGCKQSIARAPVPKLPKQVVNRQKTGFSLPMDRWLNKAKALDSWRRLPALAKENCHWSRRMAYSLANKLIAQ